MPSQPKPLSAEAAWKRAGAVAAYAGRPRVAPFSTAEQAEWWRAGYDQARAERERMKGVARGAATTSRRSG